MYRFIAPESLCAGEEGGEEDRGDNEGGVNEEPGVVVEATADDVVGGTTQNESTLHTICHFGWMENKQLG